MALGPIVAPELTRDVCPHFIALVATAAECTAICFQRCIDVESHEVFRKSRAGRQPFCLRAQHRRCALGWRLAWRRLARRLGRRRMGRLARRWMGLGPGLRCRLCSRICLGCRTRLGLGSRLGQSLLVCRRSSLRLGHRPSLALRSSSAALSLALLVTGLKHLLLAQGNL
jgi:hypothetical protein